MRYVDFKPIITETKLLKEEKKLTSWKVWQPSGKGKDPFKYIDATANSINTEKTFKFKISSKEDSSGIISKITVDYKDKDTGDKVTKTLTADEWAQWCRTYADIMPKATTFTIDKKPVKASDIYKTDSVTGSLNFNLGDVAEAILGSALSAKFEKGGADITADDVMRFLTNVLEKGTVKAVADYKDKNIVNDELQFILKLNPGITKTLKLYCKEKRIDGRPVKGIDTILHNEYDVTTDKIDSANQMILNSVSYANKNARAKRAVEKAKIEMPTKNTISVISDGGDGTQQKITKVDLKLQFDDTPVRLLSLKAGKVKQFGQVSGAEWETASNFFESVLKFKLPDDMKTQFGFKDKTEEDYTSYNYGQGPFKKLYDEIAKQLKTKLSGDVQEYNFVKNVYDGINYHATKGEENVTMVILGTSAKIAYKELAFDERLYNALELYNLKFVNRNDIKTHSLVILGYLKTAEAKATLGKEANKLDSKAVLLEMNTRLNGGVCRNMIEMGPLLKELADVEKLDQKNTEKQKEIQKAEEPKKPVAPKQPLNKEPQQDQVVSAEV